MKKDEEKMIALYFSGTGNSKYIAKLFGRKYLKGKKVIVFCTQCKLCVSLCPMDNLEYQNGKIKKQYKGIIYA
jgi:formate hydrogenlyase subunit 6/NADH:ubiquinone oxidoreductase subunit I